MAEDTETLQTLLVKIAADTTALRTELTKVNTIAKQTAGGIKSVMGDALRLFAVPLSVGAILGGLKSITSNALHLGEQLHTMNLQFDVSVEKLSAWIYAARHSNSSAEDLNRALRNLATNTMTALTDAGSSAAESLNYFGISAEQLKSMRFEDVVETIGKNMEKMGPSSVTTAKFRELFGRMSEGSIETMKNLERLSAVAEATGNTTSKEFVKVAQSYDTSSKRIGDISLRSGKEIATAFEGVYSSLADLVEYADKNIPSLSKIWDKLKGTSMTPDMTGVKASVGGVLDFSGVAPKAKADGKEVGKAVAEGVKEGVKEGAAKGGSMYDAIAADNRLIKELRASMKAQAVQLEAQTTDNLREQTLIQAKLREDALNKAVSDIKEKAKVFEKVEGGIALVRANNAKLTEKQLADIDRARERSLLELRNETLAQEASMTDDVAVQATARYRIEKDRLDQRLENEIRTNGISLELLEAYNAAAATLEKQRIQDSRNAVQLLLDDWRNTTKQLENAQAEWLTSGVDALTEFTMGGKVKFRDFANSVIKDMIRIMYQEMVTKIFGNSSGIAGFLSLFTGGGGAASTGGEYAVFADGAAGFAAGGSPPVGRASWVGERGVPELFVPKTAGTIIPAEKLASGGRSGPTVYIDARNADAAGMARLEKMVRQLDGRIEQRAVSAVSDKKSRGGSFGEAFGN